MNKVLIAVTTYNHKEVTRLCMEYLQELDHDIFVIDDCSTDGTQEYLAQIRVESYCKSERKGLTDSWNWAYRYFKCAKEYDYMILMNNDVFVFDGSIEGMLSDKALVVPMCNHDGAGYACKEQSINKYWPKLAAKYKYHDIQDRINIKHPLQSIKCWTGFCMCLSRGIMHYELDGGDLFDPKNINVGNDDDLAKRVRAYVSLSSYVYHLKGISFNGKITGRNEL